MQRVRNKLCGLQGVSIACEHHKIVRLETYQPVPWEERRMMSKELREIALDRIRLILYYIRIDVVAHKGAAPQ